MGLRQFPRGLDREQGPQPSTVPLHNLNMSLHQQTGAECFLAPCCGAQGTHTHTHIHVTGRQRKETEMVL